MIREVLEARVSARHLWLATLATGWMWLVAVAVVVLLPMSARGVFGLGVAVGALLAARISGPRVELGLLPLGAFGTSVGMAVAWLTGTAGWVGTAGVAATGAGVGTSLACLVAYTADRAPPGQVRPLLLGGFGIGSLLAFAGVATAVAARLVGVHAPTLLLLLLLAHTGVAVYITVVVREFALRFVTFLVANVVYRVNVSGHEHVPLTGPALLVSNHVSYADWFVLAAAIRRPPRFVMHHSFYRIPVVHWLFRQAKVIPIASAKENPALLAAAFDQIHNALADGQLVCLFPEGSVTTTGSMIPFRPGMERVIERDPVPVVPMALDGMWGSFFSRKDDAALTKPFRRGVWSRVWVRIGPPVPAPQATSVELQRQVASLLGVQPPSAVG